jgi:hypothetical protein
MAAAPPDELAHLTYRYRPFSARLEQMSRTSSDRCPVGVRTCLPRLGVTSSLVAGWLNSPWSSALGYGFIATLAVTTGLLQRRGAVADRRVGSSPAFWFTTALLALAMGLGRVLHAGGLVAELGRRQARTGGWYEDRRLLQVVVIGVFALLAMMVVSIGIRRWWPRLREGYLSIGLLMSALVCYSIVRVVSLHQIDSWMRGNETAGVTFGTLLELALLAAAVTVTLGHLLREVTTDDVASPTQRV